LEDTFELALRKNNIGFLARTLYHETRHFNRLSWTDETGKNRSWATTDEEERDAYKADARIGKVFGLKQSEIDELRAQSQAYADAVKNGVPITDDHLTPQQEAVWRNHYEHLQLNLDEEYASLHKAVQDEKAAQEALWKRLVEERLARERVEAERKEREAVEQRDLIAAHCGYRPAYQRSTGDFLGFQDDHGYFLLNQPYRTAIYMDDLEVAMLVNRACTEVVKTHLGPPKACNDSASRLSERANSPGFEAKLVYLFGRRDRRPECVNFFFDNAAAIKDTASFDKSVAKYRKDLIKARTEYNKRWYPKESPRDETPRDTRRAPPQDDRRRSPDHDEVWRKVNPVIR